MRLRVRVRGNGYAGTDPEGNQNDSNYLAADPALNEGGAATDGGSDDLDPGTQIFFTGKLQGTDSLEECVQPNATSPYTVPCGDHDPVLPRPGTERLNRD